MLKNNKVFISAALIPIIISVLAGGLYLNQRNQSNVATSPTPTPGIPTPVPTAVLPPATAISPIPTPTNLREWNSSTPNVNYEWTFKYPPSWIESPILKGYSYQPMGIPDEDYSLNFFHLYEANKNVAEVLSGTGIGEKYPQFIKRETFEVNGREIEMLVNKEIIDGQTVSLRIYAFIKGVNFNDFVSQSYHSNGENFESNPDGCYENGMLLIDAIYDNPPTFTVENIPYENDIKQMLTTFEFDECVPSK